MLSSGFAKKIYWLISRSKLYIWVLYTMAKIRTVLGDISPDEFGPALVHEHILVDFIEAEKFSSDRYDPEEVFQVMFPYLAKIKDLGVKGFVECTPAYMGRDPRLLVRFSKALSLHILTNTGLYKEPHLPKFAFEYTADQLAELFIKEIVEGIEDTSIKAGFIKIAVNPGSIVPIQQKIVRAAARCSLATGAVIACHTADGPAAMHLLKIIKEEGLDPGRLIVVHSDAIENIEYHLEIARQGAWVEYDGLSPNTSEKTLRLLRFMVDQGFEDQILLSQDAGWYNVGQPRGGKIRGYEYLIEVFVPLMKENGFDQKIIYKILVNNPAKAFQIS
jgi:phosphotriesterase-related protein